MKMVSSDLSQWFMIVVCQVHQEESLSDFLQNKFLNLSFHTQLQKHFRSRKKLVKVRRSSFQEEGLDMLFMRERTEAGSQAAH